MNQIRMFLERKMNNKTTLSQISIAYDLDDDHGLKMAQEKYKEMSTPQFEKEVCTITFIDPNTELSIEDEEYEDIRSMLAR